MPPSSATGNRRTFLKTAILAVGAAGIARSAGIAETSPAPQNASGATTATASAAGVLFEAIRQGNARTVEQILQREPLLRTLRDDHDRSLSWIAHESGHPELQPLLTTAGDAKDIFALATSGSAGAIVALARTDAAALNQRNRDGATPLHAACACRQAAAVEQLVGAGSAPNATNAAGIVPLTIALEQPPSDARDWMVQVLLGNGANPDVLTAGGEPVLLHALRAHDRFAVRLLLRKGADPEFAGPKGVSARHHAVAAPGELATLVRNAPRTTRDNEDVAARWGTQRQAVSDVAYDLGQELINRFVTIAHFDYEQTKRLLDRCPSLLLTKASWDEIAVEGPAHLGNEKNTRFLIERGAPVSLCTAVMLNELGLVKELLTKSGASAAKGPHDFALIWYTAFGAQKLEMAEMLLDAGADVNASVRGRSVLHEAAARDHAELIELLARRGADINLVSASSFQLGTPLDVAVRRKRSRAVDVLRRLGAHAT